ncbi:gluconate 2-dehydrogenase subunit 3 family protein [Novosphingobium umbonatum]|uniref:Gluconate 2-dehydrogenase subunit 3 family protein n=1 Tax=Novosphingobium umbonatum TaxID=1908524 RepID=A0A437MXD4_9SPHN|nr:gluconate 2-dehydrogenase subunit 3 family protein [Novosphingobium umbonatum]RVU02276.1 gluconate 2-dehydrogenase subunit 3 family protein [Novosphingobium umbonatum]
MSSAIPRRDLLRFSALGGVLLAGGGVAYRLVGRRDPVSPAFIARLCDMVLPATDTPGAVGAGVPAFLPIAFQHGLFGGNADTLGLLRDALDQWSAGGDFSHAGPAEQLQILSTLDRETFSRPRAQRSQTSAAADGAGAGAMDGFVLWRVVKDAIVSSYYTSQIGGERELGFQLIAGPDYRADVAVGEVRYLSNYWVENVF